ncbi:hypothetical protein L3X38_042859 [Prunus dulcis]|uniref:Uncharacterized protein n=1 Tax=Prunus dulcis TaxID=3755 RepID=A0AAD4UVY9_PRUDU|nr:hypothetical protein L3X38_042859 [Prunus dulcis]
MKIPESDTIGKNGSAKTASRTTTFGVFKVVEVGSEAKFVLDEVADVVFVSTVATIVTLDYVSSQESCDTWLLMLCLCFNSGGRSNAGGSCWNVVLFSTLRRPKNYVWS